MVVMDNQEIRNMDKNKRLGMKEGKYYDPDGKLYRFYLFRDFKSVEEANRFFEGNDTVIHGSVVGLYEIKKLWNWAKFFELKGSDCIVFYGTTFARLPGETKVYCLNPFQRIKDVKEGGN